MSTDILKDLLTAFIAGDREAAQASITQALDGVVHDFIFPEDAAPAADLPVDDGAADAFIPDEELPADVADPALDPALDPAAADLAVDPAADPALDPAAADPVDPMLDPEADPALDLPVDPTLAAESALPSEDDELLLGGEGEEGAELPPTDEVPGQEGTDAALGALSDELSDAGVTGDDVASIDGAPVDDVAADPAAGAASEVVGVSIDPNQGDQVVSAVKIVYADNTDFTFFTFADDAQKLVDTISTLVGPQAEGDDLGGITDHSPEALKAHLDDMQVTEGFTIL